MRCPKRGEGPTLSLTGSTRHARLENDMKIAKRMGGQIDCLILTLLAAFLCGAAPGIGQQTNVRIQKSTTSASLPDAPRPMTGEAVSSSPEVALVSDAQQPNQSTVSTAGNGEEQQPSQKPVGAAAAPPEGAAGITASRPAGAVIAPAKQRRERAILIRVGLLVGAGVALGTVLALTRATPSQPPQ